MESFDEGYTEPKVTLRRIKDGTIFDVEAVSYTHLDVYKRQVYHLYHQPQDAALLYPGGGGPLLYEG